MEENPALDNFEIAVWLAGMIDVLSCVAAHFAINGPVRINRANVNALRALHASFDFAPRNAFTDILGDSAAALKGAGGVAALPVNGGRSGFNARGQGLRFRDR